MRTLRYGTSRHFPLALGAIVLVLLIGHAQLFGDPIAHWVGPFGFFEVYKGSGLIRLIWHIPYVDEGEVSVEAVEEYNGGKEIDAEVGWEIFWPHPNAMAFTDVRMNIMGTPVDVEQIASPEADTNYLRIAVTLADSSILELLGTPTLRASYTHPQDLHMSEVYDTTWYTENIQVSPTGELTLQYETLIAKYLHVLYDSLWLEADITSDVDIDSVVVDYLGSEVTIHQNGSRQYEIDLVNRDRIPQQDLFITAYPKQPDLPPVPIIATPLDNAEVSGTIPLVVFQVADEEPYQELDTGTEAHLNDVAWSPHGEEALVVGDDGTILKYKRITGRFTRLFHTDSEEYNLHGVAYYPSGDSALIVGGDPARGTGVVLKWKQGDAIEEIYNSLGGFFNALSFSPDGSQALIVGDRNYAGGGRVLKYESAAGTLTEISYTASMDYNLNGVAYHPAGDSALIVGGDYDNNTGVVLKWEKYRDEIVELIQNESCEYNAVSWKPDGSEAVIVGDRSLGGGEARILTYKDAEFQELESGVSGNLNDVVWSDRGDFAFMAGIHYAGELHFGITILKIALYPFPDPWLNILLRYLFGENGIFCFLPFAVDCSPDDYAMVVGRNGRAVVLS